MGDDVTARVIAVIAKNQGIAVETILPESSFVDLSIDSLDGLRLVFGLEEEFGVDIPDDAARTFKSVGEVVLGLEALLERKAAVVS